MFIFPTMKKKLNLDQSAMYGLRKSNDPRRQRRYDLFHSYIDKLIQVDGRMDVWVRLPSKGDLKNIEKITVFKLYLDLIMVIHC